MAMPSGGVPATSDAHADAALDQLMRASRVVTAAVVRSLAALDETITVPQLRTLVLVGRQGPLTVTAVAQALGVNASNASRTCDRLVEAGLLNRATAEEDRRRVALTLTDAGQAVVTDVMDRRRAEFAAVVERMDPQHRDDLGRALDRFAAAAESVTSAPGGEEHVIAWLS